MPVTALDHSNLRAGAQLVEALRRFYIEVLGLREGPRPPFTSAGYWLYAGAAPIVHLGITDVDEGRDPQARTTLDHIAFACTDLPAHEALLRERGIAYRRRQVPQTGQHQLFFTDPAGNGVELIFGSAT